MLVHLSLNDLMDYTDWERQKWHAWFRQHGARLYWAIPRWLDGKVQLQKPLALRVRGAVTVADVHAAPNSDAYAARVREWARSVWQAYASQQDLARAWMRAAIAGVSSRR